MKRALVLGAGGFIGSHLVHRLKAEGFWVAGVDLKAPEFETTVADSYELGDLRDPGFVNSVFKKTYDEVYQLAADMGGAGYIFSRTHDANIMHNSSTINLNILNSLANNPSGRVFFSSSACVYPVQNQTSTTQPCCAEDSVYPANPDSDYGWEKLFSERLYGAYHRDFGLAVRIARYHNIFGPKGAWNNGREKAPAALCRKIAVAKNGDSVEIWGDGLQTRSFLYIDECIEGTLRLMRSPWSDPLNIGSEEMVSINDLAIMIAEIAGKKIQLKHIPGPQGVRGRNSDNRLIQEQLGWSPSSPLRRGLQETYKWVQEQLARS